MEKIKFFLIPGEPTGKGRPRFTRSGHTYTPERTASYEQAVQQAYRAEFPDAEPIPAGVPVAVKIVAGYGIPKSTSKVKTERMLAGEIRPTKKPDADNVAKAICDALNGLAYHDDSQITMLCVSKHYAKNPGCLVRISINKT